MRSNAIAALSSISAFARACYEARPYLRPSIIVVIETKDASRRRREGTAHPLDLQGPDRVRQTAMCIVMVACARLADKTRPGCDLPSQWRVLASVAPCLGLSESISTRKTN